MKLNEFFFSEFSFDIKKNKKIWTSLRSTAFDLQQKIDKDRQKFLNKMKNWISKNVWKKIMNKKKNEKGARNKWTENVYEAKLKTTRVVIDDESDDKEWITSRFAKMTSCNRDDSRKVCRFFRAKDTTWIKNRQVILALSFFREWEFSNHVRDVLYQLILWFSDNFIVSFSFDEIFWFAFFYFFFQYPFGHVLFVIIDNNEFRSEHSEIVFFEIIFLDLL